MPYTMMVAMTMVNTILCGSVLGIGKYSFLKSRPQTKKKDSETFVSLSFRAATTIYCGYHSTF